MVTGVNISVAGGGRWGVQYLLDGAINNNRWDATNMPLPFPDALQEFRDQHERAGGLSRPRVRRLGQRRHESRAPTSSTAMRSGSCATRVSTPARRTQPRRTSCSAISRAAPLADRSYRTGCSSSPATRARSCDQTLSDTLSIVPTAAMLSGDWSAFNACHRPSWTRTRRDFVDGQVNPARFSPAAVRLAARLPQPAGDARSAASCAGATTSIATTSRR